MLLEPVRRHESSCVLISRMGPDTQQLRVTQTQPLGLPSRSGYYLVNVNNRSTSVSLHVIAVHAARQVALRTLTRHSPAARGNDKDSGCAVPLVPPPVHRRSQAVPCPQPSTRGRSHSRSLNPKLPRGRGPAWRMRVLPHTSAHARTFPPSESCA